ncbi:MAG: hypothetical protein VX294_10430 [Candidatus Latescibacterota bacterium]|nr:hypothetical protein [Candidatus Latescibacterota bacterium]
MNCFQKYNTLLFLILCLIQACESDPILSPNAVDETDKGSYGLSSLPDQSTNESQDNENPELF